MIGQIISHYRITRQLGAGGMGVVYEAEDTNLKRTVALKFLPPGSTRDPEAKARFRQEAQAASALDHPNVCTIHEIGETADGHLFIAMACYKGETLKERIARGPLPIADVLAITQQIAAGLAKAHAQGIVHRDIKPGNLFVTEDGLVKILDFGLAKLADETRITRPGATLGTAGYMSPEQARGEDTDHRSDLWSLGVVLYEMVTGRLPFPGEDPLAVIYAILNREPEPVTALRTGVPMELERIISKGLAKDPANRYQHVDELLADLGVERRKPAVRSKRYLVKYAIPLLVVLLAAVLSFVYRPFMSMIKTGDGTKPVKIAVLPFENLGSAEDEYFADGITEEITSRLAVVPGLAVISRTSANKYKNTKMGLREIGRELDVDCILEGSIRWDKRGEHEKVRITPELINVSDDLHLWANNYEREIDEIFAIQADIAVKIVEALNITLLASERGTVEARPTENLAAYEAYLRGMKFSESLSENGLQLAIQMFERAVELDPKFAVCFARLSEMHSLMYFYGNDRTEERLQLAKDAVDRAAEIQPTLPEVHLAMGNYYHWCRRDYERALRELAIAEKGLPNNTRVLGSIGDVLQRQGKFAAAADRYKKAFELSPQETTIPWELCTISRYSRDYAEADRYVRIAIDLSPGVKVFYEYRARNYLSWMGDTARAREVLEEIPGEAADVQGAMPIVWWCERDYDAILGTVLSVSRPVGWSEALDAASAYDLKGDSQLARAYYDSARVILERELNEHPESDSVHSHLGVAYAGLGRKQDAIREGRRGVELLPVSKDAIIGPYHVLTLARIFTRVGEYDAALDQIEYLLSIPCWLSVHDFRLEPWWDPLRNNQRFRKLMEKYAVD